MKEERQAGKEGERSPILDCFLFDDFVPNVNGFSFSTGEEREVWKLQHEQSRKKESKRYYHHDDETRWWGYESKKKREVIRHERYILKQRNVSILLSSLVWEIFSPEWKQEIILLILDSKRDERGKIESCRYYVRKYHRRKDGEREGEMMAMWLHTHMISSFSSLFRIRLSLSLFSYHFCPPDRKEIDFFGSFLVVSLTSENKSPSLSLSVTRTHTVVKW